MQEHIYKIKLKKCSQIYQQDQIKHAKQNGHQGVEDMTNAKGKTKTSQSYQ